MTSEPGNHVGPCNHDQMEDLVSDALESEQPASTEEHGLSIYQAVERYSLLGELQECEALLHRLRATWEANPGNQEALQRLAKGLYFALKGSRQEVLKERHEELLQEMQQLLEKNPDESRVKLFLASALRDRMSLHHDEYYLYDPSTSFRLHDKALSAVRNLLNGFPGDRVLQGIFYQALTISVQFSAKVKQYERCALLLRSFSEQVSDSDFPRSSRYRAECLATILSERLCEEDVEETRVLVEELRTIALRQSISPKTREICSMAMADVLVEGNANLGSAFFEDLLKALRHINAEDSVSWDREWVGNLVNALTGSDVVQLAGLRKQWGLDGRSGRVSVDRWWEPNWCSDSLPKLEIKFECAMRWAGQYLLQKSAYSQVVRTIVGAVIMTAIQKAFDDGAPDSDSEVFFDQFLRSQLNEWDWNFFKHMNFGKGLTDYYAQNLSEKREARQALSTDLNLAFPILNWSWVNADATRPLEFIAYYRSHQDTLSQAAAEQVIDLTVASISKAVRERCLTHVLEAEEFLTSTEWKDSARLEPSVREYSKMWSPQTLGIVISKQLNLRFPSLTWASANASIEDLDRFVSMYAEGRKALRSAPWYHRLGELIFQSLSLIDSKEKVTPDTERAAAKFLEAQGGELASRLAAWLREGPKTAVELVVRQIVVNYSRGLGREAFPVRYGCRENGYDASSIVEFSLNCLFGFPLWTGNQDWGYCNRDGKRLKTFIAFFLSLPPLKVCDGSSSAHSLMHELIMYSLERAMDMDVMDETAVEATTAFATSEIRQVLNWQSFGIKPLVERYLDSLATLRTG